MNALKLSESNLAQKEVAYNVANKAVVVRAEAAEKRVSMEMALGQQSNNAAS